jgi:non-ribosomal peptide synthase protein (TIGR01720 family)
LRLSFSGETEHEAGTALNEAGNAKGGYLFPTSYAQERMWFLARREPGRYNALSTLEAQGGLNLPALVRSISALARRHETLRTSFVNTEGCLLQFIAPDLVIPLPVVDLKALSKDEQAISIQQVERDEARHLLDLAHGPLIRTTLLRLGPEEHVLLLLLHRGIADAWSVSILVNELNALYASFAEGRSSSLRELPIQYADYAAWQREWLQGEVLEQELAYWKERLDGAPPVLELPTDHPRRVDRTGARIFDGASYHFALPTNLTKELQSLGRKKGATLFMTLLAAFQVLLARLAGRQDIVVGTSTAGRTQIELEGLVGLFANTLVLRCGVSPNSTFDELLEQVRDVALEAYEHQELPFDRTVQALQPEGSSNYHPIVQVLFAFQNTPPASFAPESPLLQLIHTDMGMDAERFDLVLSMWENAGEEGALNGELKYDEDLFESATIARWAKHLQLLLECIAADPSQPLSLLLSLEEAELQQLLDRWSILADIWAQVLRIERPDIHTNFFEAGGDSILSLLIIARAREAGLALTPRDIFQHQTIAELAKVALASASTADEQETGGGPVPLTPIQRWFFEQHLPDPHHWNQSMLLEVADPRISPQFLGRAVAHLLAHHGALTLHFRRGAQDWEQYSAGGESHAEDPVRFVDLGAIQPNERERAFAEEATRAQASLNLAEGPLLRTVYFALGERPGRLLVVVHHLIVDTVSWRILLQDLQTACQQLLHSDAVQLPQRTSSFKTWAERLQAYARSGEVRQQAAYWLAEERRRVPSLPVDFGGLPSDPALNTEAAASSVEMSLSPSETDALLHEVPRAYHTQINEVLLTALVLACAPWTGRRRLLVDVEGHGREIVAEGMDLSRTVGWFTTIFPVLLDLESVPISAGLGSAIKAIKEQVRGIPQNGIGYGLLRYLGDEAEVRSKLQEMPRAEMSFNYLGQFDPLSEDPAHGLFYPVQETGGPVHSLRGRRSYMLDVSCIVAQGRFHVEWRYCTGLHSLETIETLARRYVEMLRALIEHCRAPEAGGAHPYTPSDFSGAGLNQAKLDKIMAKIRSNKQS